MRLRSDLKWRGLWLISCALVGLFPALTSSRAFPAETGTNVTKWTAEARSSQTDASPIRARAARALSEADKRRASGVADDLRDAVRKYESASKLWREIDDRQQLAMTLLHQGGALRELHDDERARGSLSAAFELAGELHDDAIKAESLMLLGMLEMRRGELLGASKQVDQGLSLSRQMANRRLQSLAGVYLAEIHANIGNMPKAAEFARQSLELANELGDKSGRGRAQMWLGYVCKATHGNEAALENLTQSLTLAREANDLPGIVDAMTLIGHQYSATGEKQRALETYLDAQFYADRLQDPERQGRLFAGLDFVNEELGNLKLSLEYCRRSIQLYHDANYPVGELQRYERLGKLQFQTGDYAQALENYRYALSFFQKAGMKNSVSYVLSEIGEVYEKTDGDAKALDYYNQARQLIRVEEDPREYSYVLNRIGRVSERTKGAEVALDYYNEALRLSRKASDLFGESRTLLQIARAEWKRNRWVEARAAAEAALRIDERIRDEVAVSGLRASYFAAVNQHFEFYIDLLLAAGGVDSESSIFKALEISERKRARTLLDEVALNEFRVKDDGVVNTLVERARKLKAEIEVKRDEYAKLRQDPRSGERARDVADHLLRVSQEYDQVRASAAWRAGRESQNSASAALTSREIQNICDDEDTLMLEYSLGDQNSHLWAVTRNSIESFQLPGRSEIESVVLQLGQSIKAMTPQQWSGKRQKVEANEQFGVHMQKLSSLLLGPVSARVAKARKLIVVADGALHYVPFSALTSPELNSRREVPASNAEGGALVPLLATHEISLLPSVSVLIASRQRAKELSRPAKTVAVFADPVFAKSDDRIRNYPSTGKRVRGSMQGSGPARAEAAQNNGGHNAPVEAKRQSNEAILSQVLRDTGGGVILQRLFATQFEAQGILSLTTPEESFAALNFEASRQVLTSKGLKDYRIIHIATHGFLDNEHPELSGIVLSLYDENGRAQNGFVQLRDIYEMELNADLVVLSACQTGLGKEVKGEGVTGLARAFMFAGARRVVASLWKVDDEATAALMTSFYRHLLKEKATPSAALRAAQLEISSQRRWHQPFYWAGFFISGDFK